MLGTKLITWRFGGVTWCRLKGFLVNEAASRTVVSNTLAKFTACRLYLDVGGNASYASTSDFSHAQNDRFQEKNVSKYPDEQLKKLLLRPDQPEDARILRVAVIGLPNSGKSTLTNQLLGWRVSAVSNKVHTTRKNTVGIFTKDKTQIVFLDTPGLIDAMIRKRHDLSKIMVLDPEKSLQEADLVCVMVDVGDKWRRNTLDPLLLQVLHLHRHKPAILVLNKVDLLRSKNTLLQITRVLTEGVVDGRPIAVRTRRKPTAADQALELNAMFDAMDRKAGKERTRSDQNLTSDSTDSKTVLSPPEVGSSRLQEESPNVPEESSQFPEESTHILDESSEAESPPSHESSEEVSAEVEEWNSFQRRMKQAYEAVQEKKGWPLFQRVFMVSAVSGDGVEDIQDFLMSHSRRGDWDYHSSLVTVQDPREVVLTCVREKLLDNLQDEVPYLADLDIELWEVDQDGIFNVLINITVPNSRAMKMMMGPKGLTILKIASQAKQEMMNTFRCEMRLKLIGKMKRKNIK